MADYTFNNDKGNYINYNAIPVDDLFDDEDRVVFPPKFLDYVIQGCRLKTYIL